MAGKLLVLATARRPEVRLTLTLFQCYVLHFAGVMRPYPGVLRL